MAKFLEVMGPGPNKHLLNISLILSVKASTSGCLIRFGKDELISVKTPYGEIKKAIEEAASIATEIHSIVDKKLPDATPPPQIEVS